MKHNKNIYLLIASVIIIFSVSNSSAAIRRMIGPNITLSWQSTYLAIESGNITVQDNAAWENATALGWFFDYLITPYVSLRTNWFFYPTSLGGNYTDLTEENGKITGHEIGVSVLRHFQGFQINPWFGFGPFVGFTTLDNINSYTIHAIFSVGFDYEISENVFFCPELMGGIGARIISESEEKDVSIDVPSGGDFTSSGIVIFLKIGLGKAF